MFGKNTAGRSLALLAVIGWSQLAAAEPQPAEPAQDVAPPEQNAPESTPPESSDQSRKIAADALFRQGRELMEAGEFEEACRRFEESHRLDFAVGTLMNLALCYKEAGRNASAWSAYRSAAAAARDRGQVERQEVAAKEAADLEKQLNYLVFKVNAPAPDLQITLDGTSIAPSLWSTLLPVDAGTHTLHATAPGHQPRSLTVNVEATSTEVVIEALVPRIDRDAPASTDATADIPPAHPRTNTPFIVAASVTGALAVGAGVTGWLYLSKRSDYEDLNANPKVSPKTREEERDEAQTLNVANLILSGGALLAGGLTSYYWFDSRKSERDGTTSSRLRLLPQLSTHRASIQLTGEL